MNQLSQQSIKFKALLSQIDEEVTSLKQQIKNLRKEKHTSFRMLKIYDFNDLILLF